MNTKDEMISILIEATPEERKDLLAAWEEALKGEDKYVTKGQCNQ